MPLCLFIIACSVIFRRPPGYKSGAPGLFFILIITVIIFNDISISQEGMTT